MDKVLNTSNLDKVNHKLELHEIYETSIKNMKYLKESNENLKERILDNNLGHHKAFTVDALEVGIINEDELDIIIDYLNSTEQYHNNFKNKYLEYVNLLDDLYNYIHNGQSTEDDINGILDRIDVLNESKLIPPEFTQELEVISSKLPKEGRYLLTESQGKIKATNNEISILEKEVGEFYDVLKEFNEIGIYIGIDRLDDIKQYREAIIERRAYINEKKARLESDNLSYDKRIEIMKSIDDAKYDLSSHIYVVSQVKDILENHGSKVFHSGIEVPEFIDIDHNVISDNLLVTIAGFKVYDSSAIQEIADYYYLGPMTPLITGN